MIGFHPFLEWIRHNQPRITLMPNSIWTVITYILSVLAKQVQVGGLEPPSRDPKSRRLAAILHPSQHGRIRTDNLVGPNYAD